ncbi:MlaE family ABC transporter permease [Gluconobacter wancherniae]|uniref:ABC transporter permease n=1 Tax=Gluconobacter wancherniae NBRC 103581 TaxID=656744 RepID=A0A511AXE9_9PROT|nr:ABC transporter permease [Gluconobacter wancherniae]MBF0853072.1 ABC transporter permease [Gluconobacter wancherniae]MBS1061583.1 ABC transporter permease [Gluconobacter wancherniae]MBS1087959.1 ABC transporter permease [Gluconobacter wancherniae]MBS1093652.1 ABC transporter permease [Gluconobacter wancherniae]GBD56210.1 ABC transporter permease [Gluconobacter wancherniae NBRC 103581]
MSPQHKESRLREALVGLGRFSRTQLRFTLMVIGGGWGVVQEARHFSSWRRTVRIEFWQTLRQATGGGLLSVLVTAALTGFGIVAQAVYWLGFAGMAQMTGSILSTVLVREIAPVLVGVILLGRSGMLMLTELGTLTTGGQMRVMAGMGIDPFLAFVMPRTLAMTISGFTLGMIFSLTALVMGYLVCWVEGIITMPVWAFLDQVTSSMRPIDYFSIPAKFTLSGFIVGLCSCLSGMDATSEDDLATLLPRGFARGILSVMIINVVFSVGFD